MASNCNDCCNGNGKRDGRIQCGKQSVVQIEVVGAEIDEVTKSGMGKDLDV